MDGLFKSVLIAQLLCCFLRDCKGYFSKINCFISWSLRKLMKILFYECPRLRVENLSWGMSNLKMSPVVLRL